MRWAGLSVYGMYRETGGAHQKPHIETPRRIHDRPLGLDNVYRISARGSATGFRNGGEAPIRRRICRPSGIEFVETHLRICMLPVCSVTCMKYRCCQRFLFGSTRCRDLSITCASSSHPRVSGIAASILHVR